MFPAAKLTVVSAYRGSKYDDLCISDVQVYIDGDDTYSAASEQAAAERIRASVAERRAAAAAGTKSAVILTPRYTETELGSVEFGSLEKWSLGKALKVPGGKLEKVLHRARAAAAAYTKRSDRNGDGKWVRLARVARGLSSRTTALASAARGEPGLGELLGYLALKDFAIFESSENGPDRVDIGDAISSLDELIESKDPKCGVKCEAVLRSVGSEQRDDVLSCYQTGMQGKGAVTCADICLHAERSFDGECRQLRRTSEYRGSFAVGPLSAPTQLFWHGETIRSVERDHVSTKQDDLIAYQDGLATSLVSVHFDEENPDLGDGAIFLFEWDKSGPLPRLARMYRVSVDYKTVRVYRYDSA